MNSGPALGSLFAEQCRLDVRTPLPGKRGGKTRQVGSLGPRARAAARQSTLFDACALAHAGTRRARRGVTFSESTADDNTTTVTEFQCQKVGDLHTSATKISPKHKGARPGFLPHVRMTSTTTSRSNFLVRRKCQNLLLTEILLLRVYLFSVYSVSKTISCT